MRSLNPMFTLYVRGFNNLKETLDHYFVPKSIDDGEGCKLQQKRKIKHLPPVLFFNLKRSSTTTMW